MITVEPNALRRFKWVILWVLLMGGIFQSLKTCKFCHWVVYHLSLLCILV